MLPVISQQYPYLPRIKIHTGTKVFLNFIMTYPLLYKDATQF